MAIETNALVAACPKIGRKARDHGEWGEVRRAALACSGEREIWTTEGIFSIFKRGERRVYQRCGEQHLHRYLAEFDFRHNRRVALSVDDPKRAAAILKGAEGKRLMYYQPREAAYA